MIKLWNFSNFSMAFYIFYKIMQIFTKCMDVPIEILQFFIRK